MTNLFFMLIYLIWLSQYLTTHLYSLDNGMPSSGWTVQLRQMLDTKLLIGMFTVAKILRAQRGL